MCFTLVTPIGFISIFQGKPPSVVVDVDSSEASISEKEGNEDPEEIRNSFKTTSNVNIAFICEMACVFVY